MSPRRRRAGGGLDAVDVIGIAVWVVVFAASTGPLAERIGLLEGLWLVGPLVVVPMGLSLLRPPAGPARELRLARLLALPAGLLVVVSVVADPGPASAWFTAPWVIVAALGLWVGLRWVAVMPTLRAKVLVPVVGLVLLALAAANLVAWRAQLRPLGLSDTAVALAAVHFTLAGFGAAVVADRTRANATRRRSRSAAGVAGLVTVAAMPVLAAGLMTERPAIDLLGSAILALGLLLLSLVMLVYALRRERAPGASALLVVSAASLLFALALAVQFAFARWTGGYTLPVTRMLELHGTVGGLGFVVGGLLGWTIADVPEETDV